MKYRPDIDGLRAVAVLIVLLCHAGLGVPGGYIGVDVFFVISGFLIASLMLKELDAGTFSLVNFWERRIRRLAPALFVVILATLVLGFFILVPATFREVGRSVEKIVCLRANLFFARDAGYFEPAAQDRPLLHTWSLAVEEQFYLIVPLLFWAVMRFSHRGWLAATVGTTAVWSLMLSEQGARLADPKSYFFLSTRAWELLAGVLLALPRRSPFAAVGPWLREGLAVTALAAILVPCWLYNDDTTFPGLTALPPVLGALLLIGLGGGDATATTRVHRLLASRPAVGIGLISYSLYLWHWPLIAFLNYTSMPSPTTGERWLIIGLSFGLAVATYYCVELPFRHRQLLATRPRLFSTAAISYVGLLYVGAFIHDNVAWVDRLPERARVLANTPRIDKRFHSNAYAKDVPHNLRRAGALDVEPKLIVWGDSHAAAIMPAIDELAREAEVGVYCVSHAAWPPLRERPKSDPRWDLPEANELGAAVVEFVRHSKVRTVVLAGYWIRHAKKRGFNEALLQTVADLRSAGCRVYFLKDPPMYEFDVAAKVTQYVWQGRDTAIFSMTPEGYQEQNAYCRALVPQLLELGAEVLDPFPVLQARLKTESVAPFDDGGTYLRDPDHLSVYGALALKPLFVPAIEALAAPASIRSAGAGGSTKR